MHSYKSDHSKSKKSHLWLIALPLPDRAGSSRSTDPDETDRQRYGLYSTIHDALVGAPNRASPGLHCHLTPLDLPPFRTGTLDSLVKVSDEIAVSERRYEAVIQRIIGNMSQLLNMGQEEDRVLNLPKTKISLEGLMLVGDKTPEQYSRDFAWNAIKYRNDVPLRDIIETFNQVPCH
jgi:hypothetical protein